MATTVVPNANEAETKEQIITEVENARLEMLDYWRRTKPAFLEHFKNYKPAVEKLPPDGINEGLSGYSPVRATCLTKDGYVITAMYPPQTTEEEISSGKVPISLNTYSSERWQQKLKAEDFGIPIRERPISPLPLVSIGFSGEDVEYIGLVPDNETRIEIRLEQYRGGSVYAYVFVTTPTITAGANVDTRKAPGYSLISNTSLRAKNSSQDSSPKSDTQIALEALRLATKALKTKQKTLF